MSINFGLKNQVTFNNMSEYYYAMGFLANNDNAELRWEHNEDQGAWGSEGRIHCLIPADQFPQYFRFTAGRGKVYARINCNEYVSKLIIEHKFSYNGALNNISDILSTVPARFKNVFMSGFNS